jgi:hypothetical protein
MLAQTTFTSVWSPKYLILVFAVVLASIISGCQSKPSNEGIPGKDDRALRTDCGVVYDTQILNPIERDIGQEIFGVSIIEPNIYKVTLRQSEELVILYGLDQIIPRVSSRAKQAAVELLNKQPLFLYIPRKATPFCRRSTQYGEARIATIVTQSGVNISEEFAKRRYANVLPPSSSFCYEDLVRSCYQALFEDGQ